MGLFQNLTVWNSLVPSIKALSCRFALIKHEKSAKKVKNIENLKQAKKSPQIAPLATRINTDRAGYNP
jgi:hypothetical protein